ncbi:MAG: PIN domain-containing protein [Planctomycetota bacterium]
MKYLVDADVLSEPTKPEPSRAALAWLRGHEPDLLLSAVTMGEVRYGVLLLPKGRRRRNLERWLASGLARFPVVDFDEAVSQVWAELLAELRRNGTPMPVTDSLVAATAVRHGLVVATNNIDHFSRTGVELINPFDQP